MIATMGLKYQTVPPLNRVNANVTINGVELIVMFVIWTYLHVVMMNSKIIKMVIVLVKNALHVKILV
jgi:hypothetical protein